MEVYIKTFLPMSMVLSVISHFCSYCYFWFGGGIPPQILFHLPGDWEVHINAELL